MASAPGRVEQSLNTATSRIQSTALFFFFSYCVNACTILELKIGKKLNEGKTKQIFELMDQPGLVLVQSKDQITAGNAARKDQMEGKAAIANKTTSCVFKLLQESGEDLS